MKVTLVGAGNLATNLGKALFQAGHVVEEVYSRTMASATALADSLNARATTDLMKLKADSDVYIVAVKDQVLGEVVASLSKLFEQSGNSPCFGKNVDQDNASGNHCPVVVHTAGSVPMSLFGKRFHHYGVLYPMQTFSKDKEVDFREIPVFIEGNDEYSLQVLRRLGESVSDHVQECTSEQRKQLHLAAVFACNFVNHCYALSAELLRRQGIDFSVMFPLIDETARKVHLLTPLKAQTGPAIRYDENIIAMQSALLNDLPYLRALYLQMSQSIHRLASMHASPEPVLPRADSDMNRIHNQAE